MHAQALMFAVLFLAAGTTALAQNRAGTGKAADLFGEHCAACHGLDLTGREGGSLLDASAHARTDADMQRWIRNGNEDLGMPAFEDEISEADIRSLVIYIREMRMLAERSTRSGELPTDGVYEAGGVRFRVEPVVEGGLETPWSLAFLPDGSMLVTERNGRLRPVRDGVLLPPITGTPTVWRHGQGGLLDVALHPEYARNGWVYLSFSEGEGGRGSTAIARGRIRDGQWVDEEKIFSVPEAHRSPAGPHFGTRIVFKDGFLFFAIGDRGRQAEAQNPASPNGRVHRIHDDGRIPADNPFLEVEGAFPSSWTLGNRNIQGLDLDPLTGALWATEHGPRGGDELNRIRRGLNYGWPVITHGMNYNGTPITALTEAPGMEQPALHWTPSISVCGIDFYEGSLFPEWRNNLFIGGLASRELHRVVIEEGKVTTDEIVLFGIGRVRDVTSGPEGALYLVLNGPDRIVRLVPET